MNFVKEFKVDDKFLLGFIKSKYSKIGINSIEKLENYLSDNNLNRENIMEKFYIQIIWNDLIFQKFKNKVVIDKEKISVNFKIVLNTNIFSKLPSKVEPSAISILPKPCLFPILKNPVYFDPSEYLAIPSPSNNPLDQKPTYV